MTSVIVGSPEESHLLQCTITFNAILCQVIYEILKRSDEVSSKLTLLHNVSDVLNVFRARV